MKPEAVYRVVPKKAKAQSKKKKKTKKKHLPPLTLHSHVSKRTLAMVLATVLLIACALVAWAAYKANTAVSDAADSAEAAQYDADTIRRMYLIGSEKDYPNEITNYQSAPEDLQAYTLKDYKQLKTHCIVNGNFAGPVSYEIVNVVYDSFARIEKNCSGTDTVLLKKMSGIWTVVYSGNDLPECDDVNAFGIPQGISYNCRDGFKTYTNPNP